ncbi:MAG: isoprenylcysteine carboxylmethyltransferase family protein [Undibacterium sp.]|nr:isoprenylcysteine carboxylmethyltransferase family protein [Opitutaceae bacterium]
MHSLELKVPPLVVLVFVAALMWFGSRATPTADSQVPARDAIALGLAAVGVGVAVAGVVSFRIAKTTVNPLKPAAASALVKSGIYQLTRNPMYLGALIVLIGWAVFLENALGFVFVPSFVLDVNRFQIGPKERALTSLFPSEFSAYCANVRRWL